MILHVGAAEKAEINREHQDLLREVCEHQDLLREVCAYRAIYCLDDRSSGYEGLNSISAPGHSHQ
jgi:hypothetical protein